MKSVRYALLLALAPLLLNAEEAPERKGLRDALYLEEVKRDSDAAASAYAALIEGYTQQQQVAATAMFRLAEIRRIQGRKDESIALYQRLIAGFPQAVAEITIAKENLAALGGKLPEVGVVAVDKEELELQRLIKLNQSSPDLIHLELESAVNNGYLRIVKWLMKDLAVIDREKSCLCIAVQNGNAEMTKLLIDLLGPSLQDQLQNALYDSCSDGYREITRILLGAGADPRVDPRLANAGAKTVKSHPGQIRLDGYFPLANALYHGRFEVADLLLEAGASTNSIEGEERVTPLAALLCSDHKEKEEYFKKLIEKGADIHTKLHVTYWPSRTPNSSKVIVSNLLSLALLTGDVEIAKILIAKGAKKDGPDLFSCLGEVIARQWEVVELLIGAGADPNAKAYEDLSLLALAYRERNEKVFALLLAKGANPNVDSRQKTDPDEYVESLAVKSASDGRWSEHMQLLKAGAQPKGQYYIDQFFRSNKNSQDISLADVKMMVERGGIPRKDWMDSNFPGANNEVKAYLREKFSDANKKRSQENLNQE
jgi:ankyrin repeat protein